MFDESSKSYEMFKNTQLNKYALSRLKNSLGAKWVLFLPHDFSSINMLEEVGLEAYKVSSGQFTNLPLVRQLINIGKPLILSTGVSSITEITKCAEFTKNNFKNFACFILLHYILQYQNS